MCFGRKINVTTEGVSVRKTAVNCSTLTKFDSSNKFDLCYYLEVNLLWLKSKVVTFKIQIGI